MGDIIGQSNEVIFLISALVLGFMYIKREDIADYLRIETKPLVYLLGGIFLVIVTLTMIFNDSKKKFSHISSGYNKMRPSTPEAKKDEKPHRWFDIDFDSIFPWK